jgi:bla regulator protein blaR1
MMRACVVVSAVFAVLLVSSGFAQGLGESSHLSESARIAGTWQGTLHTPDGRNMRLVLKITRDEKAGLIGTLYSLDQNGMPMTGNSVSFAGGTLRFVNQFHGLTYEGKISADGNSISGTMTQNGSVPLDLERATPETEWAIPAPPRILAMAADATPGVEVATIKPSPPNAPRTMLTFRGSEIVIERMSLKDLVEYAWGVHEKQIAGGPAWMETNRWDIEAKPDTPGMPDADQMKEMVRKLLEERFALKFHQENREMAAYELTVGKDGPKMARSGDPAGRPGYSVGPGGLIRMHNATMSDFAGLLTRTTLDRPVLNRTGLEGRWNFELKWLWDESQFGGQVPAPPPGDPAASLPPLFTAIQEQMGLKLESQKAEVPVLVIDHVDRPSAN